MIRITQDNLRTHIVQFLRRQGFDRRLCADGHKHGGLESAVRRPQKPGPGTAALGL